MQKRLDNKQQAIIRKGAFAAKGETETHVAEIQTDLYKGITTNELQEVLKKGYAEEVFPRTLTALGGQIGWEESRPHQAAKY